MALPKKNERNFNLPQPSRPKMNEGSDFHIEFEDDDLPDDTINLKPRPKTPYDETPDVPDVKSREDSMVDESSDNDEDAFEPISFDQFEQEEKDFNDSVEYSKQTLDEIARMREDSRDAPDQAKINRVRKQRDLRQREGTSNALKETKASLKQKSPSSRGKDPQGRDEFIDKDKKKILPFGGMVVRESRYDTRENLEKKRKLVRNLVLGLIALIAAIVLKNVFFPPKNYNEEEIRGIANSEFGRTGFPVEGGGAFATQFIEAYLTNGNKGTDSILSDYQNGQSANGSARRSIGAGIKQSPVDGAVIYQQNALSPNSASYIIGVNVQRTITTEQASNSKSKPKTETVVDREFYNVNVYYNSVTGMYSIAEGSPTLVAPVGIGSPADNPKALMVGNGTANSEIGEDARATVEGFVKAYMSSSPQDYKSLQQYTVSDPPVTLKSGFDNAYQLGSETIQYTLYETDDPTVFKVVADLNLKKQVTPAGEKPAADDNSGTNTTSHSSKYVITIKKGGEKYLVSDFRPYLYIADPNTEN